MVSGLLRAVRPPFSWALGLSLAGCLATDPPGEQVGIFDVSSTLEENTCGPTAVIAGDHDFAVEVRRDAEKDTLYWQYLGGQPLVGDFDDEGFELQLRTFIRLYGPGGPGGEQALDDPLDFAQFGANPATGTAQDVEPGCTLMQEEVLRGQVAEKWLLSTDAGSGDAAMPTRPDAGDGGGSEDAGVPEEDAPDLSAEHVQTLTPTADSRCSAALGSGGGPFVTLPCEIRYTLRATRRD